MRRTDFAISLLGLLLLAWGAAQACAATVAYAPLKPASLYAGVAQAEHGRLRVELRLLDGNFFVLTQEFTPKGRQAAARDLTGNWRQVEDGALLQLTSRHGLSLRLNVGGGGNLYADFSLAPGAPPQSLVLKKAPWRNRPFNLMGRLDRPAASAKEGGGPGAEASLTDSATGRVFAPVTGKALDSLPADNPLFVDAVATLQKNGLRVEEIRSHSTRMPSHSGNVQAGQTFAHMAGGQFWRLPAQAGLPQATCFFNPSGQRTGGRGSVEVTGPGLRLVAAYEELSGQRLAFTVKKEDARMLRSAGFQALLETFEGVSSWSLENEALVLTAANGRSVVLEKVRAPQRGR